LPILRPVSFDEKQGVKVKRYRTTPAKPGELKGYYGKPDRYNGPDFCAAYGEGAAKADMNFLLYHFSNRFFVPTLNPDGFGHKEIPSFIQELESRGYDITTLKFSIQKKV
jgi:hypothetical protein